MLKNNNFAYLHLYPRKPIPYARYCIIVLTKSIGCVIAVAIVPANNDNPIA